ncbi:MAG: SIMPL domain-containing protein [Bacillota bacterium]
MFGKKSIIIPVLVSMAVFALLVGGCGSEGNQTGNSEEPQVIQAYGEAEISAEPDMAEISLSIETRSTSAEEAVDENAELANAVRDALLEFGLAEDEIKTGSYRLHSYKEDRDPEREMREPEREEEAKSAETVYYEATNEIEITIDQIDLVGEIIDTAVNAGANRVNQISFDLKDPQDLKTEALAEATEQATRKAEAIAEGAGESITGIFSIREERSDYTPSRVRKEEMADEADAGAPTPIEPGQVNVRVSVVAEYTF